MFLTPRVCVDVLLTGDEQAGVEPGEDEAVVPRLPGELDAGGVGHAGDGDAVAVLGGRTERLGHLLFAHAPVGGHEGHAAQEEGHERLQEGEARGAHLLQEGHRVGVGGRLGLVEETLNICVSESVAKARVQVKTPAARFHRDAALPNVCGEPEVGTELVRTQNPRRL